MRALHNAGAREGASKKSTAGLRAHPPVGAPRAREPITSRNEGFFIGRGKRADCRN
jgi:hypothetical protein